jgi:hypothetical protein
MIGDSSSEWSILHAESPSVQAIGRVHDYQATFLAQWSDLMVAINFFILGVLMLWCARLQVWSLGTKGTLDLEQEETGNEQVWWLRHVLRCAPI